MSTIETRLAAPPAAAPASEFSMGDFAGILWRRWWLILIFTIGGLVAAVIYLNAATYKYTAVLRVGPVETDSTGLAKRLGGLASVAGIIPKRDQASPFDLYTEAMSSIEVARVLARRPALLRGAFANEWTAAGWREPAGGVAGLVKSTKHLLGLPIVPWRAPDAARLGDWIETNLVITKSNTDPLVTIEIENADPKFAADFLNALDAAADRLIRERTLRRTGGTIGYLQRRLSGLLVAEHREALAQALGEQERARMMAAADVPFAADRFGDIKISNKPTSPRGILALAVGVILGMLLGVLAALAFHFARGRRTVAAYHAGAREIAA